MNDFLTGKTNSKTSFEPQIFNLAKKTDLTSLQEIINPVRNSRGVFKSPRELPETVTRAAERRGIISNGINTNKNCSVIDDYEEQEKEYYLISNPTQIFNQKLNKLFVQYLKKLSQKIPLWQRGRWVYFPWLNTISHILAEEKFLAVRTARNQNLITKEEQKKFYGAVVGIAGLSIGHSIALTLTMQGAAKKLRLADHDYLALSNLNRIRTGVQNLGLSKVELTAREIYTINPYANITLFKNGLTPQNIDKFFLGPPRLDIVIDEIDNLGVKYLIRERARKLKIPVVMAADNEDSGVVDVERYDQNPQTKFFHDRMGKISYEKLASLNKLEIGRMITKHVGLKNISQRMRQSLLQIGKTIVSWPQLGGAATLNGAAVAYCVRRITNNQPLINNRAIISLAEKLNPKFNTQPSKGISKIDQEFKKFFG